MKILLATQNKNKIHEIRTLIQEIAIDTIGHPQYIAENQTSYLGNALIKAKFWKDQYPNHYILADDSGLEIDALNGKPGINSAHWGGMHLSQDARIELLLESLSPLKTKERDARFVCYMVLISPMGHIFVAYGECIGRIAFQSSGNDGFGFDPIFLPVEYKYKKSFSEISMEQKNRISHRYHALKIIKDYVQFLRSSNAEY